MDENMSDDENQERTPNDIQNPKRFKTEGGSVEESSNCSNNTEQETASTSRDSGFPRSQNSRNRSYRNHSNTEELQENGSDGEENGGNEEQDSAVQEEDEDSDNLDDIEANPNISSPGSSNSTVINDTDVESEEEEPPVMKKEKPKHNWFIVPEVFNRQLGSSSKLQSSDLFQKRCYGSLHCVRRLELIYKLEGHDGCVNSLNFHPKGHLLASGSDDLNVILWDWKMGKNILNYDSQHKGNVFQTKFLNLSGDLHIASCARDGQVRIAQVSVEGGVRDNRKLGSHRGPCHKIAVLADQPHVVLSAGEDGFVFSHDVRKNKQEKILYVKDNEQIVALYSICGNPLRTMEFCVSGRDEQIRVYDLRKSNDLLHTYHPFKRSVSDVNWGLHVTCAVYNYDGSQILGSYNDGDIYLFDSNGETGSFLHQYQGHRNGATIKGVNFFGPRSEFIVSGSDCGNVYFWDKNTEGIVQWLLADGNGVVNCLEPHPQVPFIATSGLDWDVKVWVPSCEIDPEMTGLSETIKQNYKSRMNLTSIIPNDINESQMLWMLWTHLRSASIRAFSSDDGDDPTVEVESSSSSSSSNDDGDDLSTRCSPS